MRKRKDGILYLVLIVLTILSGICQEGNKTPSFLVSVAAEKSGSSLEVADIVFRDTQFCTPEMLGVCSHGFIDLRQTTGRISYSGRVVRFFPAFLCIVFLFVRDGVAFRRLEDHSFAHPCLGSIIATYIHKLDGKKRD